MWSPPNALQEALASWDLCLSAHSSPAAGLPSCKGGQVGVPDPESGVSGQLWKLVAVALLPSLLFVLVLEERVADTSPASAGLSRKAHW